MPVSQRAGYRCSTRTIYLNPADEYSPMNGCSLITIPLYFRDGGATVEFAPASSVRGIFRVPPVVTRRIWRLPNGSDDYVVLNGFMMPLQDATYGDPSKIISYKED